MTKIIEQRTKQLSTIISAWNGLAPEEQKQSINFAISLIQSASLIQKLTGNLELTEELDNFKENYQAIFGKDISRLGASDLNQDSVRHLQEIKKIEFSDSEIAKKRSNIASYLSSQGTNLGQFRESLVAQTENKYQHAHSRVSFNYGNFYEEIEKHLTSEKKEASDKLKSEILQSENADEFYSKLVELSQIADIPRNFDQLKARFGLDGIEEHTAINQGTLYRANIDNSEEISNILNHQLDREAVDSSTKSNSPSGASLEIDLRTQASDYFRTVGKLKSLKVSIDDLRIEARSLEVSLAGTARGDSGEVKTESKEVSESASLQKFSIGSEIEFLLLPKGGPKAQERSLERISEFEKLNKGLADIDSRVQMRRNYGFPSDALGYTPNFLLFYSEEELEALSKANSEESGEKRESIKKHLQDELDLRETSLDKKTLIRNALQNVDLLSKEEIFFFDLFYVKKDLALRHKLTADDIFDWREGADQQNYEKILQDIGEKGSFDKKTLDMIRAHEMSIGEFPIESAEKLSANSLEYLRQTAQEHGFRIKDRDIQINIGQNKTDKDSTRSHDHKGFLRIDANRDSEGILKISVPEEATKVGKAIQEAFKATFEKHPWFGRKGQDVSGIEVIVDRKKGLISQTKESPYFVSYDKKIHDPQSSAFLIHRQNTGKSQVIRFARISAEREDAVFEVRLIGNNTHIPHFDEYPRPVFNGFDIIPEVFIRELQKQLKDSKLVILSDSDKSHTVSSDGRIEGVSTLKLKRPENKTSLPFNTESRPSSNFRRLSTTLLQGQGAGKEQITHV